MPIPGNVLANADDLGLNASVNKAILHCFEEGYINSASVLTNTIGFQESVQLIHTSSCMHNLGVHVNLAEGRPLTNINRRYLDAEGNFDIVKTGKKLNFFNNEDKQGFIKEIHAQINLAIANKLPVIHLDSHYHLHTLPGFYKLFIKTARHFNLKLRLAQTYKENSYVKFLYRQYINRIIVNNKLGYSTYFETVDKFLAKQNGHQNNFVEIMLHPDFDLEGNITDHFDKDSMLNWINFVKRQE
ncbi:ChbG/HpnK family deacetylase [Mucilaginibacter sp.]|jgi:hypothetical protein|uniref:ChbG/HpnK family deacetylase n=1 Tax=Mucilaginibacter sp. TaxID=1882438 RepID=UPI003569020A